MMALASAWTDRHSSYRSPEGIFMASRVQQPRSPQFFRPRGAPLYPEDTISSFWTMMAP